MTDLDHERRAGAYFDSAWPVECGGSRRQKIARTGGPSIQAGERLTATTRDTGGWAVMFVQRRRGELYLLCGAGIDGLPPQHRPAGDSDGWVERVDPITLETIDRSPALSSGGWLWCGAIVVHRNGDLYAVNGRFAYRLDPACNVVAERRLPVDGPYNGLLILPDGNLLARNLGFRADDRCAWVVLDPDRLDIVAELVLDDRCMGRFSADTVDAVTHVYFTTENEIRRLRYTPGELGVDTEWKGSYAAGDGQTDGWDTSVGDDSLWMMDMGRPSFWLEPGSARQRAFRFSIDDPSTPDVIDEIGSPGAWNPGPPLYDPVRQILVHYDSTAATVVAHRYLGPGEFELLWRKEGHRNYVQMLCWADTGELVLESSPDGATPFGGASADLVIVDIETGHERGRTAIGMPGTFGMFCCPGFERDVYVAGIPGGVARVFVADDD
ncbi:MAG: hypothetical protein HRT86_08665 [Ilumatobacteraceae bacterium]|nr:hypothetical protein [Ilumatobacteraceae bacterium]